MSRQYDAKQHILKVYPERCTEGENLFLNYLDVGYDDFIYEEGMTPEEYIYGPADAPPSQAQTLMD